MFRHIWTIATVVMCSGGFIGYSMIRVASVADATDDANVPVQLVSTSDDLPPQRREP